MSGIPTTRKEIEAAPREATRKSFGRALARLGGEHENIVALDADLAKSTQSLVFGKRFPERFFEMGICEANMIGTAAGLALSGFIPFACSFACFLTGRYDTIRLSLGYSNAHVRLVGTHSGVAIGEDGHSQMGLEDVALMRAIPNMAIFQPCDEAETYGMMGFLVEEHTGPAYLRLTRQAVPRLHDLDSYRFQLGRLDLLREGSGPAIFASGAPVAEALLAADALVHEGLDVAVYNVPCLHPLEEEDVIEAARKHGKIVTVEDHILRGGLGSIVCEILSQHHPTTVRMVGVEGFGQSGSPADLVERYGLTAGAIATAVRKILGIG